MCQGCKPFLCSYFLCVCECVCLYVTMQLKRRVLNYGRNKVYQIYIGLSISMYSFMFESPKVSIERRTR